MASASVPVRYSVGLSPRNSRSKSKASRTQPPEAQDGSQPELQVSYAPVGHETMAAIAEELFSVARAPAPSRDSPDEAPEVSIGEAPAGRDTLALIAGSTQPGRAEQSTLSYGDRISNAPGAKTPSLVPAPAPFSAKVAALGSAPEISIGESTVGRETLAVISAELAPSVRDGAETASEAPFAIFEMLTFVVQGRETASLSSEALRRRFVEEHLLHRLPAKNMAQVDRVDVTPWTVRGTVVVRVWCKL